MRPVNPIDQIFLRLDDAHQPMHVGGLQLFRLPDNAGAGYVGELAAAARQFTQARPPFNRRLRYRFNQPFWSLEPRLDLTHHVRHVALTPPGAIRDLLALISTLHGTSLDQGQPMWEAYYIEGLDSENLDTEGLTDRRFAIYTRFHHALMDGVSAMRVMQASLGKTADTRLSSVPWQVSRSSPTAAGSQSNQGVLAHGWSRVKAVGRQASALPGATGALVQTWLDADHPDIATPTQAPRTLFNRRITGARRIAAQSYSLSRVKQLAARFEATVNDVVLAMCASALRRYLLDRDALPAAPLIAMVPVSFHDDSEENGASNRVGLIYASLATHIAEPTARLAAIQRSVNYWKRRYKTMSSAEIMAFLAALSAPAGLNLLTGIAPAVPAVQRSHIQRARPARDAVYG